MSESLAVRHRPRSFASLVGQRHVSVPLRAMVERSLQDPTAVAHQLLFSGGSGLGKTTIARILAASLLCETPNEDRPSPGDCCGSCGSCTSVWNTSSPHPDVIELDAASHGGVNEIRSLAQSAQLAPLLGNWKIYILDEAQGITTAGNQALLKLLEEPPSHVVFCLATTHEPERLDAAIRGRCQVYRMAPPTQDELSENLCHIAQTEGWTLDLPAAETIVEAVDPATGVRGTVMGLEKISAHLSTGASPLPTDVAAWLGLGGVEEFSELTAALVEFDHESTFAAYDALLLSGTDVELRRRLLRWASDRLLRAVRSQSNEAVDLALWRYETLLTTPAGRAWTELILAKLASPRLDPGAEALQALLSEAERRIGELTALLSSREEPAPVPEKVQRSRAPKSGATKSGTLEPSVEGMLAEVQALIAKHSKVAAALVSHGRLEKSGKAFRLVFPGPLMARVQASGLESVVLSYASSKKLKITVESE